MSEGIRTFIAVDVSPEAKDTLEWLIGRLKEMERGRIRWGRPQGIHLTLKFLGDVDPDRVKGILEAVEKASSGMGPFQVALSGVGAFPNPETPRVIWVGLQGQLDSLVSLQQRVEQEMASLGFPKEGQPFSPHLTLGRVIGNWGRGGHGLDLSKVTLEDEVAWRVDEVHLMQSTLTPAGAIYQRLGSIPLRGLETQVQ